MHSRNTKDGSESPSTLCRVPQVAQELAVSVRSIWRLLSVGELSAVKIGRSVRITRSSLDAFIAKGGTSS